MQDPLGSPPHGWCVQVFLLADHASAMRTASLLEQELGEPTTAVCVDGSRWPVVIVETVDDPAVVTAAARLCRALDPTSTLTHCSTSRPWSMRTSARAAAATDAAQPA